MSRESTEKQPVTMILALSAMTLLLFLYPGAGSFFQLDSGHMFSQPWRLITCHFTHWNANHLLWDLLIFAVVGWICERLDPRSFLLCLFSSSVLISLGVWLGRPDIQFYRGLSGIDAGLYTLLAVHLVKRFGAGFRIPGYLALLGFLAKLLYETATGSMLFVEADPSFEPMPLAHLIGAVCGMIVGLSAQSLAVRLPVQEALTPSIPAR